MRRLLLLLALATACGADSTRPEVRRGLTAVDGANVTDTVVAILNKALVMEVHDSTGAPPPAGTVMRFAAINASISAIDASAYTSFLARDVDATGRAAVIVRLGHVAGVGRVVVSVPTLGYTDTVT